MSCQPATCVPAATAGSCGFHEQHIRAALRHLVQVPVVMCAGDKAGMAGPHDHGYL
jgi:hypothetical protein